MGINQAELPVWGTGPMVSSPAGPGRCRGAPASSGPGRSRRSRAGGASAGIRLACARGRPRMTGSRVFIATCANRPRPSSVPTWRATEKFTTSVRDGIDIRETLRNWHTGDLYVKVVPPSRGSIEVVVFLFDIPADPQIYVNRTTWYAEHAEESTLAFYATDPMKNLVGPGIAQAQYGGALFIFPPRPIPDVWSDRRLDFTDTLEERLLAAALLAQSRQARRGREPQDSPGKLAAAGPQVRPQDRPPAAQAIQRPASRAAAHVSRAQRQAGAVLRGGFYSGDVRKLERADHAFWREKSAGAADIGGVSSHQNRRRASAR